MRIQSSVWIKRSARIAIVFAVLCVAAFQWAASNVAHASSTVHAPVSDPDALQRSIAAMGAALAQGRPIVLMFSTPGCPYCHALRTEHLNELKANQDKLGVFFVEFDLSDRSPFDTHGVEEAPLVFRGLANPRDLARRLAVRVAPTLVFLGPEGELSERLIGYGARDFYAGYLDQRLREARSRLRTP